MICVSLESLTSTMDEGLAFGPFVLKPHRLLLMKAGRPLRLGARPLTLLAVLASRPGEVMSFEALKREVWPGLFVEDANVRVQVSALRKILGDNGSGGYIANVAGQGYSFAAPVRRVQGDPELKPAWRKADPPALATPLIGRDRAVEQLASRLGQGRLVSIVGPGGVGKTSLAVAVASAISQGYAGGAAFVDLAPVTSVQMVRTALAAALGVEGGRDSLAEVIQVLKASNLLIVLDNCEHVVEAASEVAEALLRGCPDVAMLATSREPLRAASEQVYRLDPLDVPPEGARSALQLREFSSVQLFEERARATLDGYRVSDLDAQFVGELCRRLDGLPLALELAAAAIDSFGAKTLAAQLSARFDILTRGRPATLPRQQTLRATLDWSYARLSHDQQRILQRLSIFSGMFTLEAARAAATCSQVGADRIVVGVAALAAKSLISVDLSDEDVRYRLLESTRAYGLEKLSDADGLERVALTHARWCKASLVEAEQSWTGRDNAAWVERNRVITDDVRAALERCLGFDEGLGAASDLLDAAMPLFFRQSLVREGLGYAERLLARMAEAGVNDSQRLVQAKHAVAVGYLYTRVMDGAVRTAWVEADALARDIGDTARRLNVLGGLWTCDYFGGDAPSALAWAREYRTLADSESLADRAAGDYFVGCALHANGNNVGARAYLERVVSLSADVAPGNGALRYAYPRLVSGNVSYAKVLWLLGFVDQAVEASLRAVAAAEASQYGLTLGHALIDAAANIAMLRGESDVARNWLQQWRDYTSRYGYSDARDRILEAHVLIAQGQAEEGERIALHAFAAQHDGGARNPGIIGALAEQLANRGRINDAEQLLRRALGGIARHEGSWVRPEILRALAVVRMMQSGSDAAAEADSLLRESLALAIRIDALAWRLRTAVSMSRLWREGPQRQEAVDHLSAAFERFTEGFETVDYRAARIELGLADVAPN